MHENTFEDLLTSLNRGESQTLTFNRPLKANVEIAKHWLQRKAALGDESPPDGPYNIYLVREFESGPYIGLVHEAGSFNLHWYTRPESRGKGYLSQALKSIILPHLFQENRELQEITINRNMLTNESFEASVGLAKSVGFKCTDENADILHYAIGPDAVEQHEYIHGDLSTLTDVRAQYIRSKIDMYCTLLEVLQSELEMKLGMTDDVVGIESELKDLKLNFDSVVSDAYVNEQIEYENN